MLLMNMIINPWVWLGIYLLVVNVLSFILFGIDKKRASYNGSRIPNATLLGLSVIGGSIGGLFGMYFYRHKTKTWYYVTGIPIIISLQIMLIFVLVMWYL